MLTGFRLLDGQVMSQQVDIVFRCSQTLSYHLNCLDLQPKLTVKTTHAVCIPQVFLTERVLHARLANTWWAPSLLFS